MSRAMDLTGKIFGRLLVIRKVDRPKGITSGFQYWLCRCECGNEKIFSSHTLRMGHSMSCGCLQRETQAGNGRKHYGRNIHDLTGKRYGSLTVLEMAPR